MTLAPFLRMIIQTQETSADACGAGKHHIKSHFWFCVTKSTSSYFIASPSQTLRSGVEKRDSTVLSTGGFLPFLAQKIATFLTKLTWKWLHLWNSYSHFTWSFSDQGVYCNQPSRYGPTKRTGAAAMGASRAQFQRRWSASASERWREEVGGEIPLLCEFLQQGFSHSLSLSLMSFSLVFVYIFLYIYLYFCSFFGEWMESWKRWRTRELKEMSVERLAIWKN